VARPSRPDSGSPVAVHHVVWQHFRPASPPRNEAARLTGVAVGTSVECGKAGCGEPRFSTADEDFDIPGEGMRECDRRREQTRVEMIGVARRGIHLHEHRDYRSEPKHSVSNKLELVK